MPATIRAATITIRVASRSSPRQTQDGCCFRFSVRCCFFRRENFSAQRQVPNDKGVAPPHVPTRLASRRGRLCSASVWTTACSSLNQCCKNSLRSSASSVSGSLCRSRPIELTLAAKQRPAGCVGRESGSRPANRDPGPSENRTIALPCPSERGAKRKRGYSSHDEVVGRYRT